MVYKDRTFQIELRWKLNLCLTYQRKIVAQRQAEANMFYPVCTIIANISWHTSNFSNVFCMANINFFIKNGFGFNLFKLELYWIGIVDILFECILPPSPVKYNKGLFKSSLCSFVCLLWSSLCPNQFPILLSCSAPPSHIDARGSEHRCILTVWNGKYL